MALTKPTQITVPFASSGLKNTIPETATGSNRASMQEGFPAITMQDVDQGGMAPYGQDMNGIIYDVTKAIQYQQAGGFFPYDATFAAAIDGYPIGAIVTSADGTQLFQNTLDGNQSDPENGGANWSNIMTSASLAGKQDKLNQTQMDAVNSGITSAKVAIYDSYASTKQNTLTFDNTPTNGSSNPVTSDGIYTALGTKQDTITVDASPTDGSTNPVSSGGVYTALAGKIAVSGGNSSATVATATGSTTARTLANRFADVINVKDFGAVGDGVRTETTTETTKPKPLMLIIAGQSNAAGTSGEVSSITVSTGGFWKNSTDSWVSGFSTAVWPSSTSSGMATGLAEKLSAATNRPVYIVNVSVASTIAVPSDQNSYQFYESWSASGNLRARAKAIFDAALDDFTEPYDFVGTVWLQGETDASGIYGEYETISDYSTSIPSIIDWFVDTFGGKFFAIPISYSSNTAVDSSVDAVNSALASAVTADSDAVMITEITKDFRSDGYLRDDGMHYTQTGYDLLGETVGTALASYATANLTYQDIVTTHSYSGTDDTAAINNAFAHAASVKKAVIFPVGNYLIGNSSVRNITIPDGVPSVDFDGSTIVRAISSFNGASIQFDNCKDLTIKNLNVVTKDNSIYGNAVRGLGVKNLSVSTLSIVSKTPYDNTKPGNWGFTLSGENIRLQDIHIDNFDIGLWGDGIHLGVVKNFTLDNFEIYGGDDAISICQHAPYTGTWSEDASENIVIGNGIIKSKEASAVRIQGVPETGSESAANRQAHTVRKVLVHDVVFAKGNHLALQLVDTRTAMENPYTDIVFDSCIVEDDNSYNANIIVGGGSNSPVKVDYLSFQNSTFIRRNANGAYSQIFNVKNLNISGCNYNDSSYSSTDWNIVNCDDVFLSGNRLSLSNSSSDAITFRIGNVKKLFFSDNVIENAAGTSTVAVKLTDLQSSASVRLIGNLFKGTGRAVLIEDSAATISEIIDVWNYIDGTNSLSTQAATTKVIANKDTYSTPSEVSSAINTALADYYPKAGGVLTGAIKRSGDAIVAQGDSYYVGLYGGTTGTSGAGIVLSGKDRTGVYSGRFSIKAINAASGTKELIGQPDGTFTWNGQTIQTTSDARLKTSLQTVPDNVLDAWGDVNWGQFQFLEAVESKGTSARQHLGLIAQRVKEAFENRGLDACAYGILCHEVWEDELDEEGNVIKEAGDLWMVRYDEAQAMEAAYQRRRADRIESRLNAIEERLK